ncbi:hypothetical protein BYT27DRAFT_7207123 [Phlegmacium glaucopus]|nr:hypothetical protein BYT27DRAFT_7207123 [Phlegmacium glaucopus]
MADNDADNEDIAPKKRKTTYNQQHPTDNPKPPKHSRAEVQAAAAEKKAATIAKKNELAGLQAAAELEKQQKKKKGLKEVAAMEDAVQRQQKQRQLQAERPDLQTMQTYRTINARTQVPEPGLNNITASSTPTGAIEQDGGELSDVEMPPRSTFDTDSDGGLENVNYEGESEYDSDIYAPVAAEDDEDGEQVYSDSSNEQSKTSGKKK